MSTRASRSRGTSGGRGSSKRSAGRGPQGRGSGNKKPQQSTKFKGSCPDLEGHIFDCSDYKQADNFVHTLKRISEFVGAECKHGGDIRSSIVNETKFVVPEPATPDYSANYATAPTPEDKVKEMMFKGVISAYIKRTTILDDNIQKAFSLILGQCTDLLQSKLKQQADWQLASIDQDVI